MLLQEVKASLLGLVLLASATGASANASFSYEAKSISIGATSTKWYYVDQHGDIDEKRYSGSYYDIDHTSTTGQKVRILAVRSDMLDKTKRLLDAAAEVNDLVVVPDGQKLIDSDSDLKKIKIQENRLDASSLVLDHQLGELELTEEETTVARTLLRRTTKWQLRYVMRSKIITQEEPGKDGAEVVQARTYPLCRCPKELVPTVLALIQAHREGRLYYFRPEHLTNGKLSKANIDHVFTPKGRRTVR